MTYAVEISVRGGDEERTYVVAATFPTFGKADDFAYRTALAYGDGNPQQLDDDIHVCNICDEPDWGFASDWNGETGNHLSCEQQ